LAENWIYFLVAGAVGVPSILGGYAAKDTIWKDRYLDCQGELNETELELETCRSDLSTCQSDLSICRNERSDLETSLNNCRGNRSSLSEDLEDARQNSSELYSDLQSCREELSSLRDKANNTIRIQDLGDYDIEILNKEHNLSNVVIYLTFGLFIGIYSTAAKVIWNIIKYLYEFITGEETDDNQKSKWLVITKQVLAVVYVIVGLISLI
jgi:predicted nuclease with TOPRIM domain